MEYQALYRKYRPQTFDEVIGQGHVTTTLAREVAEGRVAHAYLFAGPRGTGKTTTARILAKALNCENRGKDGTPCNECGSCLAITEGSSLDVLELDAASHNSVDDIRDIRISVTTVASVETSKRVFVLDEAHMLSKAAGNALLKTLEEPPDHVIFVLATTEPYKLLDTIRSRTQRFDFHPVSIDELAGYLSTISDREGYKAEPAALVSIARHAGGSVRDSLSLLEQVAALGSGKVDAPGVRRALGLSDADAMMTLARAVAENDAKAALGLVAEMAGGGVDLRRFVSEAIGFFRGVFLAQYAPNLAEISDEAEDIHDMWMKAAEITDATIDALLRGKARALRINYANGDMVGHTGVREAAILAVEAVDLSIGRLIPVIERLNGALIVTADHGNADEMYERGKDGSIARAADGRPRAKTSHTLNPVPFYLYAPGAKGLSLREDLREAGLANIAATVLELLGFTPPEDYEPSLLAF